MDLLNLYLTSTYFQYNGKYTTNSCMEQPWGRLFLLLSRGGTRPCNLPSSDTALVTLHWWHFYAVRKDEIDAFHDHLNEQNANIQFNKDIK